MNYIVFDISEHSPSLAERDIIWSVLLFGDKVQITSNMALPFLIYGDFPQYTTEQLKLDAYELFKPMFEKVIPWNQFELEIKHINKQRKKKNKTGLEVKDLASREVWLRKTEKWFKDSLRDNLAKYNYEEIVPLTYRYPSEPVPDVTMTVPLAYMNLDPESVAEEHFIKIITNGLSQTDSLFVFDERILPFIVNQSVDEYTIDRSSNGEKAHAFSEKVFTIPLCFTLKTDEIKSARNEMKHYFQSFNECIHQISTSEAGLKSGMERLRSLLPDIQNKIESSNFVLNVRNQLPGLETVDLHVGFTTNRGMLTIIKHLGMLKGEEVLQASDIVIRDSNLDMLHPFIYITHPTPVK